VQLIVNYQFGGITGIIVPVMKKDYFTRLNYLLMNPIKHEYVDNLNDYSFSSFHQILNGVGKETCMKQFRTYPDYKQLVIEEDDF